MSSAYAWCLVAALSAAPDKSHLAADEAATKAKDLFKTAQRYYREARYADAIAKFEETYALRPSPVIFFNIGKCYEQLGDVPKAMRAYRDYLRLSPQATDKDTVNDAIANLERRLKEKGLQQLLVFADPPTASIEVDGRVLGNSPSSVELTAGNHKLVVRAEGYETSERSFVMQVQRATEVTINLRPLPARPSVEVPKPALEPVAPTAKANLPNGSESNAIQTHPVPEVVRAQDDVRKSPLLFVALRGNVGVPVSSPDLTTFFGSGLVGIQVSEALSFAAGALVVRGGGAMARVAFVPFNADGRLKPVLALEVPAVFGPSFSLGVGLSPGVQFDVARWLSLGAELPLTYFPVAPLGAPNFYIFGAVMATVRFL